MSPKPIRDYSLGEFQKLNDAIYGTVNSINYGRAAMVSRMHRYITQALKCVRKGKTDQMGYYLAMAFSWSLAFANRMRIDLEKETWKRFPGLCPYCGTVPCSCTVRAMSRASVDVGETKQPETLREYQEMFRRIYPENKLQGAVTHLAEEVGELDEVLEHFKGTHEHNHSTSKSSRNWSISTRTCAPRHPVLA